jgi:hypothetical protein
MSEATATASSSDETRIVLRDDVVRLFGTPDETVGSVNDPRAYVEHGIEFNEKWVYRWPRNEPTRPRARAIYWKRYDFVASVRIEQDGSEVRESPADLVRRRPAGH